MNAVDENSIVEAAVEAALNPETFDAMDYLKQQPVAVDTVDIYVDVAKARRVAKLLSERGEYLAERRAREKAGKANDLSIGDADEDTEFDDEINSLLEDLEATKMIYHIQSVAPALRKAIEKKYAATTDKEWSAEELETHERKSVADVLGRAISHVELPNGAVDNAKYTPKRLMDLEDNLYEEQGAKLITALWAMVHTGQIFDEVISADFS